MRNIYIAYLTTIFLSVTAYADTNNTSVEIPWGYSTTDGPDQWAKLNPAFELCAKGKHQSPINISKRIGKTPPTLAFYYEPAPLSIVIDGETNIMIGQSPSVIADGHSIQLNFPSDKAKESIMLDDDYYRLVQLHIHKPSEHQLQGQTYPLEIHMVHQGVDGHVAVVGVLVKTGGANPGLQKMIDHLPQDKGVEQTINNEEVNPKDFIPQIHDYYNYFGSLTIPPCTEGLQWIVMAEPITASSSQMAALRKAMDSDNARPVQPLQGRRIYFSRTVTK